MTVMILISFLSVLGAAMVGLAGTSRRVANRRYVGKQALALAQAGSDLAAARLLDNPSFTGINSTALGAGTVAISVATPTGQASRRVATVTATVTSGTYLVSRQAKVWVTTSGASGIWGNALAAKTSFTLGGNIGVNSHPSLHAGHIHCNENTTHNGGGAGSVDGRSTATGTITLNGNPTIAGGTQAGVAPLTFPAVDQAFKDQSLANGVTSGCVSRTNGSTLQGKINGDVTIGGPSGAQVNGVVWVTGTVTISGPVTGTGTIVSDGAMTLNSRTYDERADTASVAYISTATGIAISMGGNRSFKGILYAPNGTVRFQGGSEFYGMAAGNSLTFGGNPNITRWTNYDSNPPPLPSTPKVEAYQEL